MQFNQRFNLTDKHSFLSPSSYHWLRYDDDKLAERWVTNVAAALGTRKHKLASDLINLKQNLPRTTATLNAFVNDVIGYRMQSEQVLYYSDNCFGTADAIGFKRNLLRVFDLKTGKSPASFDQLLVYSGLFCLEYHYKPFEIEYDLRIYQNDECLQLATDKTQEEIAVATAEVMARIIHCDKIIEELKAAGEDI